MGSLEGPDGTTFQIAFTVFDGDPCAGVGKTRMEAMQNLFRMHFPEFKDFQLTPQAAWNPIVQEAFDKGPSKS